MTMTIKAASWAFAEAAEYRGALPIRANSELASLPMVRPICGERACPNASVRQPSSKQTAQ
jgi:hypothetical protein